MNEATARRHALARSIAPGYIAQPKVAAVLLAGSVARGTADAFSDIELDVFWREPPTDEERRAPIAAGGGRIVYVHPFEDDEWAETYIVGGVKVDTSMFLTTTVDRYLDTLLDRAEPAMEPQLLVAAIQHGTALYGADVLDGWRARAAAYPAALARAMIEQHLDLRPRFLLEMLAERDDLLFFQRVAVELESRIMGMLLGLNRAYQAHPHHKWLDWQAARLPLAPPDLAPRLKRALRGDPRAAVCDLAALLDETLALVERELPEIDTGAARAAFDERRVPDAA